ncbi:type I-G CRISPR-associated helicase/endonuclease Cas3g [Corynebacterium flavescens]
MLSLEDFDEFFAELNGGNQPFTWQVDLLRFVVETGQWPQQIVAPTGAGKSSVVDVHVFANALSALGKAPRIPRRLHSVVNRRGLVDSQFEKAIRIQERLDEQANEPGLLAEVHKALRTLQEPTASASCLSVSLLRGGLSNRSLPVDDPASCAIISATPDMWGSRALFHGYGSSRLARPRETSLLTFDSVLVLDESHINQQLLATARRVRQLQDYGRDLGVPHLQVVETTATPSTTADHVSTIGVQAGALDARRDQALAQRMHADKFLRRVAVPKWNGRPGNKSLVNQAVAEVETLLRDPERAATIGCVVNHVDTALKVASELRKKDYTVELLVGRMRPHDLAELKHRRPKLLTVEGDATVGVVVATQTLEVGVDIDFASLVTELAPATSLAQRMGRVNRLGRFQKSEVLILQPQSRDSIRDDHPPYLGADLRSAWEWLDGLSGSVNPAALASSPPPSSEPRRALLQRLEMRDLDLLSRSNDIQAIEPSLEFWLRDSLESEPAAGGVIVRELPIDDTSAVELLKTVSPTDDEVFPASLKILRQLQEDLTSAKTSRTAASSNGYPHRAFVWSAGEISQLEAGDNLKPGDVLVIDHGKVFTSEKVATQEPTDRNAPLPVPRERITVYFNDRFADPRIKEFFRTAVDITSEELTLRWQEAFPEQGLVSVTASTSLWQDLRANHDEAAWIVVEQAVELLEDPEARQEWSTSDRVYLKDHQEDVAQRSESLCSRVGLEYEATQQVYLAALHHDDGKADPRFQRMLGNVDKGDPWAKSENRSNQYIRRRTAQSGLPLHWRHEQYSALLLAARQLEHPLEVSDLSVYIAGTSHGYGRDSFPHTSQQLLFEGSGNKALAKRLFDQGYWESMSKRLAREYGTYQLAYLSFIERAADAQISKEGR